MPKHFTPEVKDPTVSSIMKRQDRYKSIHVACSDLGPKLNLGKETLRRCFLQPQKKAGEPTGTTSKGLAEDMTLTTKVKRP